MEELARTLQLWGEWSGTLAQDYEWQSPVTEPTQRLDQFLKWAHDPATPPNAQWWLVHFLMSHVDQPVLARMHQKRVDRLKNNSYLPPNRGLPNKRFACYFNTIIQAFLRMGPLMREWIGQSHLWTDDVHRTKPLALIDLLGHLWVKMVQGVSISKDHEKFNISVLSLMNGPHYQFDPNQQHDAGEMTAKLVDLLPTSLDMWGSSTDFVRCDYCGNLEEHHPKVLSILQLSLPVGNKRPDIDTCLTLEVNPVRFVSNQPCNKCVGMGREKWVVHDPGNVLIVSINRTRYNGSQRSEIDKTPVNWSTFLQVGEKKYRRISLAQHLGQDGSGHWVLWTWGGDPGILSYVPTLWKLNDGTVTKEDEENMSNELDAASIGFYERMP